MFKSRWVKFAFYFLGILAGRLLLMRDGEMTNHLLHSFFMAVFFLWFSTDTWLEKTSKKGRPLSAALAMRSKGKWLSRAHIQTPTQKARLFRDCVWVVTNFNGMDGESLPI